MQFPYTRINSSSPPRPYVNLFFRVGFATTETLYGLVDTGADYPILPYEFADDLKLNFSEIKPWTFTGTTGKLQIAYPHEVEASIWDPEIKNLAFRFNTVVAFCPDFKFAGGLLLGQTGFLSYFEASFNQAENYFLLHPHNEAVEVVE